MRKVFVSSLLASLMVVVAVPVNAVSTASLDQRVQRLERMMENPVLLQLSRRLGEQQRDIQSLQDENDRLQRQLNKLTKQLNQRYAETDERLSQLEGSGASETSVKPVEVEQPKAVIEAEPEVKSEAVESVAVETNDKATNTNSLNATDSTLEKAEAVSEKPAISTVEVEVQPEEAPKSAKTPIKTRPATEAEKEAYKAAFALMRTAKYSASIKAFESFIQKYPNSDLASNASYWAGEGYLVKEQADKALEAFLTVLNVYPGSPKVPDATLRAGDSYERLGQQDNATKMFKQIIENRPLSKAAKNAQKRLQAK